MNQSREVVTWKVNGFLMLLVHLVLLVAGAVLVLAGHLLGVILLILFFVTLPGYTLIQPNEARVLLFFGKYVGSVREDGFFWLNPFAAKKKISLRVRNFQSDKLKVNDADGNPILIGAVIVWRVVDSAKALLDVEDFDSFVAVQSETAIRAIASRYPYDRQDDAEISLAYGHRRCDREFAGGIGETFGDCRGGSIGSADQPFGICPGNRPVHVAPPASAGSHCRTQANC